MKIRSVPTVKFEELLDTAKDIGLDDELISRDLKPINGWFEISYGDLQNYNNVILFFLERIMTVEGIDRLIILK